MSNTPLHLRPATADDRAAVMAISAQIWDGDDYYEAVWDAWLADTHGHLTVATLDTRVVAVARAAAYAPGEWWLEGIRVDKAFRGQGIAHALHDYHVALAMRAGAHAIRYTTGVDNQTMHRIGTTTGFQAAGCYTRYRAEPLPRTATPPVPALELWRKADLPALARFTQRTALAQAAHGLYLSDWHAHELTPARLAAFVAQRSAWGWRGADGAPVALALVEINSDGDYGASVDYDRVGPSALRLRYADARPRISERGLIPLLRAVRSAATRRHCQTILYSPLENSPWSKAADKAGYTRVWNEQEGLLVFEILISPASEPS